MNWTYDPTKSKYTRELMERVIAESASYYEVFRKLGLKPTGSANGRIRVIVAYWKLDTSHFLGRASNCGPDKKGGPARLHFSEVLVLDRHNGRKEHPRVLRRALIESGVKHECEDCHMLPEWNGKPLVFQIDHRNGNSLDNRPGNARFMCPNCHSQTPNFGVKNATGLVGEQKWAVRRTKKKRVWRNGQRLNADVA